MPATSQAMRSASYESKKDVISARLSDELRKSLGEAAQDYASELAVTDTAQGYLRGRGIEDRAQRRFGLGVVSGRLTEHAAYAGMISIPYMTRLGGVCAIKFRQPYELPDDDESPKYLAPAGQATRIYNSMAFDLADKLGYIGITEGEFDAMILDYHCGIPSVGIPGVDTWKKHPEWKELFRGYDRVLMFRDGDDKGGDLAERIQLDIEQCRIVTLNQHKDASLAFLAEGPDFIRERAGIDREGVALAA